MLDYVGLNGVLMVRFAAASLDDGTETCGHARTGKGTPLKTSIFEHLSPTKQ